jgi:hypothetical protein
MLSSLPFFARVYFSMRETSHAIQGSSPALTCQATLFAGRGRRQGQDPEEDAGAD